MSERDYTQRLLSTKKSRRGFIGLAISAGVAAACGEDDDNFLSPANTNTPEPAFTPEPTVVPTPRIEVPEITPDGPLRLTQEFSGHVAEKSSATIMGNIAAGPESLVLMDNSFMSVVSKRGVFSSKLRLQEFFRPINLPGRNGREQGLSYTRVVFDRDSQRFFALAAGRAFYTGESVCADENCEYDTFLAVSKTQNPESLGVTDWNFYRFSDGLEMTHGGTRKVLSFAVHPMLGISKDSVVISSMQIDPTTNRGLNRRLRILEKSLLIEGLPVTSWTDLTLKSGPNGGALVDGLTPAISLDDQGSMFFLSHIRNSGVCSLGVWELQDPLGKKALKLIESLSVGSCQAVDDIGTFPKEPGGLFFDRVPLTSQVLSQPVYRQGSLWAAHSIPYVSRNESTKSAVRWFQIDLANQRPRFVQDNVFVENGAWSFCPAISVDSEGNMGMVYTRSGAEEYGSAYFTGRLGVDELNRLRPSSLLQAGRASWGHDRWGYYQGIASDPIDESIWMMGAYVHEPKIWGTWVGQLSLDQKSRQV